MPHDRYGANGEARGEACITRGRKPAAIAIAIVSATDRAFPSTLGGYFHGMVSRDWVTRAPNSHRPGRAERGMR